MIDSGQCVSLLPGSGSLPLSLLLGPRCSIYLSTNSEASQRRVNTDCAVRFKTPFLSICVVAWALQQPSSWPFTPKMNRTPWPFFKLDMRHRA